jgi:hypothetical protein
MVEIRARARKKLIEKEKTSLYILISQTTKTNAEEKEKLKKIL